MQEQLSSPSPTLLQPRRLAGWASRRADDHSLRPPRCWMLQNIPFDCNIFSSLPFIYFSTRPRTLTPSHAHHTPLFNTCGLSVCARLRPTVSLRHSTTFLTYWSHLSLSADNRRHFNSSTTLHPLLELEHKRHPPSHSSHHHTHPCRHRPHGRSTLRPDRLRSSQDCRRTCTGRPTPPVSLAGGPLIL
jgi:hypothetical protein